MRNKKLLNTHARGGGEFVVLLAFCYDYVGTRRILEKKKKGKKCSV